MLEILSLWMQWIAIWEHFIFISPNFSCLFNCICRGKIVYQPYERLTPFCSCVCCRKLLTWQKTYWTHSPKLLPPLMAQTQSPSSTAGRLGTDVWLSGVRTASEYHSLFYVKCNFIYIYPHIHFLNVKPTWFWDNTLAIWLNFKRKGEKYVCDVKCVKSA